MLLKLFASTRLLLLFKSCLKSFSVCLSLFFFSPITKSFLHRHTHVCMDMIECLLSFNPINQSIIVRYLGLRHKTSLCRCFVNPNLASSKLFVWRSLIWVKARRSAYSSRPSKFRGTPATNLPQF